MTAETASPSARLFLALWPPAALADRLHRHCRAAGVHGEAAARLHLTLHFLGAVPRTRLPELGEGLAVACSAFALDLGAFEAWRGGLLVLRPQTVPPELLALHQALAARLADLGLRVERRAFRPHLTVQRRRDEAAPLPPPLPAQHWAVDRYVLAESVPGPGGGYRVQRAFALRRGT